MGIRQIYKNMRKKKQLRAAADHIQIAPTAVLGENFNLELHSPTADRVYLQIGEKSMIDSSFVFETEGGHISIGDRVHIGGGTQLISRDGISIGDDVIIAWNCTIYDHNSHAVLWEERKNDVSVEWENAAAGRPTLAGKDWSVVKSVPIRIEDKAWIGFGVSILKGVTIGEGAVVAAGSVVTRDVPPYTVVGGNPAQVLKAIEG